MKNIFKGYAVFDARMKTRMLNVFHIAFADKDVYLIQMEMDFGTKLPFKYGPKKRYAMGVREKQVSSGARVCT